MIPFVFGHTENSVPILGYSFGDGNPSKPRVLIIGGVHGNEIEGVQAAHVIVGQCLEKFTLPMQLTVVPEFNLDGILAGTRTNARGVDLNRNLPTQDWDPKAFNKRYPPGPFAGSESENRALIDYLKKTSIDFIISLHSFTKTLLNVNGDCEPMASIIHQYTGLPIDESMGYPTPGCLGTYTGLERKIPTITYEIKRGLTAKAIIETHVSAIFESLKQVKKKEKNK